jgi:hypothetical protein
MTLTSPILLSGTETATSHSSKYRRRVPDFYEYLCAYKVGKKKKGKSTNKMYIEGSILTGTGAKLALFIDQKIFNFVTSKFILVIAET